MSEHHIIPSSRGGKLTCELPDNFHEAWHVCFQNMTPEEICVFVEKIQNLMYGRYSISWAEINAIINSIKKMNREEVLR